MDMEQVSAALSAACLFFLAIHSENSEIQYENWSECKQVETILVRFISRELLFLEHEIEFNICLKSRWFNNNGRNGLDRTQPVLQQIDFILVTINSLFICFDHIYSSYGGSEN